MVPGGGGLAGLHSALTGILDAVYRPGAPCLVEVLNLAGVDATVLMAASRSVERDRLGRFQLS